MDFRQLPPNVRLLMFDFEVNKEAKKHINANDYLIIPLANPDQEDELKRFASFYSNFGIVSYIGSNENNNHHRNLIRNASAIVFCTGIPLRLDVQMKIGGLDEVVKERIKDDDLLMIGHSAGMTYFTDYLMTHKGQSIWNFGLGCIKGTAMFPHVNAYGYLNTMTLLPRGITGFGMTDWSALLYQNDMLYKLGNERVFIKKDRRIKII